MRTKICNISLPLNVCLLRRIEFVISHIIENYTLYIGKAQRYNASVTEWTVSAMTSLSKMAPIVVGRSLPNAETAPTHWLVLKPVLVR